MLDLVEETKSNLINDRVRLVWAGVEGWVGDRVQDVLRWIEEDHRLKDIHGDIVEIGVHHGKFFFMIDALARKGECSVAIDIWEDQRLNVDSSGCGSKDIFLRHVENIAPQSDIRIISGDSMSLKEADILASTINKKVRFLSVDGGHTVTHVVNDLSLAQNIIVPGGIIALDDFMGTCWPTVSEGFYRFMDRYNRRLAPFLIFQNKLWLTTYSEYSEVLASAVDFFARNEGQRWHTNWRYSHVGEFKVLIAF